MCKTNSNEDFEGIGVTEDMKRCIESSRKKFETRYSMSQSMDNSMLEVLKEVINGQDIIVVAPKDEFRETMLALGGEVIEVKLEDSCFFNLYDAIQKKQKQIQEEE